MNGTQLPGLEIIERCARPRWQYRAKAEAISPEKLKAVLLWSRALQFALKNLQKLFGMKAVWELVEWHGRATTPFAPGTNNGRR